MDEEMLKEKYRTILNQLNQLNHELIFYEKDFHLLKETINQYIQVNDRCYGESIYNEIQKEIAGNIQKLNNEIIPSIISKF